MSHFYSTKNKMIRESLENAVMKGQADDGGLFMPEVIPQLPGNFFEKLPSLSFSEIAFEVAKTLLQGSISDQNLKQMVETAMNFEVPLKKISSHYQQMKGGTLKRFCCL